MLRRFTERSRRAAGTINQRRAIVSYRTCCACLFFGTCLLVGAWTAGPAPRVLGRPAPARPLAFRGTASCASTACHGGTGPQDDYRSAYTTWMAHDRHARAYQVLLSDQSRRMVMNYRHLPDLQAAHPETDLTCLKCHTMDAAQAQAGCRLVFEDGVGCERCHGPAELWLTTHYTPAWRQTSAGDKATLGFRDTKDLLVRAQLCVECHVGAPGQDVDHDLIAAGHPRLNFELAAFEATMPPHWNVRQELCRHPDREARLWLLGQAVSTEQALELLAYRAEDERKEKSWPEFAEYACFACHQNLQAEKPRLGPARDRAPGSLPWNDWYYALPRVLAGADSPLTLPDVRPNLAQLSKVMSQPLPDRKTAAAEARKTAQLLHDHLAALAGAKTYSPAVLEREFGRLARSPQPDLINNWDGATQRYLALAALYQALGDGDPASQTPGQTAALKALAQTLRFPTGYDSPRGFEPAEVRRRLEALRK